MPPTSCSNHGRVRSKLSLPLALLLVLAVTQFLPQVAHAAAGDLDPTFGVGGKRTTDFFGNDDVGAAVAVQPDGKIVIAGVALSGQVGDFALARYNADGSPDSSFGTGGKTTTDFFGDIDLAFGVALQPSDGKIVAVGTAVRFVTDHYETFFAIARYNTNGTLDPDFGTGGRVTSDVLGINIHQTQFVVFLQAALGIVIQPDNKVVVVGGIIDSAAAFGTPAPLSDFGIARFNSNGTPDTGFSGDGRVQRDFFGRDDIATSVALQPDNKIVAAGYATKNTSPFDPDFAWVRYDTNGFQDTSIGSAGRVTTDFVGNTADGANAMVLQPDGKIVLGGFALGSSTDMALIRYNADASLDGSFGTGGKATINVFGGYDELFGLALQPDGKIVATGGTVNNSLTEDIVVARLTSGGVLDSTFGSNGKVTTDFSGGNDFGAGVALQPDGKILVSGAADTGAFTDLAILRYLAPPSLPLPTVQLSSATFSVSETGPQAIITVNRSGDTSGVSSVAYGTSDTAGANTCNVNNGVASARCDYLTTIGTLQFAANETSKTIGIPLVDDAYDETDENFRFTISNASAATLGTNTTATVTITDNDATNGPNPTDTSSFFVRQHYIDFLNREPDASGLAFWTGEIENCTPKPECTEIKRINVSAAFFLSIEFQETGYLVYRFYKAGYGNIPNTPVPVTFNEFLPDTQQIGKGVVVGDPGFELMLENNKIAFAQDFVARTRFTSAYSTTLTPAQFVDALFAHAEVTPSATDRDAAINEFGVAGNTSDTTARARALRRVAENSTLAVQEKNSAFVLMQYFGYLRRNPYDPPEPTLDFQGFNFWLGKLNQFNGNFVEAEMVKAFIISGEYRQRFGP